MFQYWDSKIFNFSLNKPPVVNIPGKLLHRKVVGVSTINDAVSCPRQDVLSSTSVVTSFISI